MTIVKKCSSFNILTAASDHGEVLMGDHDGADVWNVMVDDALYGTGYERRRRRWERIFDNVTYARSVLKICKLNSTVAVGC